MTEFKVLSIFAVVLIGVVYFSKNTKEYVYMGTHPRFKELYIDALEILNEREELDKFMRLLSTLVEYITTRGEARLFKELQAERDLWFYESLGKV